MKGKEKMEKNQNTNNKEGFINYSTGRIRNIKPTTKPGISIDMNGSVIQIDGRQVQGAEAAVVHVLTRWKDENLQYWFPDAVATPGHWVELVATVTGKAGENILRKMGGEFQRCHVSIDNAKLNVFNTADGKRFQSIEGFGAFDLDTTDTFDRDGNRRPLLQKGVRAKRRKDENGGAKPAPAAPAAPAPQKQSAAAGGVVNAAPLNPPAEDFSSPATFQEDEWDGLPF
jgi:hypothetical protein